MKKKLIVVLVLALTCITLLTGCSQSKTYEVKNGSGSNTETKVESKLAFHLKGEPKIKLIFADDGFIYFTSYESDKLIKGTKYEKHGDIIITSSTSTVYKLYDNGKFLTKEKFDSYPSIEFYEAD